MKRPAILVMAGVLVPAAGYTQSAATAQAGASTQSQADANVNATKIQARKPRAAGSAAAQAQRFGADRAKRIGQLSEGTTMNAALAGSLDVQEEQAR